MMPMQGSLSVERMCRAAAVSRASFYRWLEPRAPVEEEMEVRAAMQAVVLEHRRRYGYRRVTAELRRRGLRVNHKRVARLKTTCLRSSRGLGWQPPTPGTNWRCT
jgi:putative transposase